MNVESFAEPLGQVATLVVAVLLAYVVIHAFTSNLRALRRRLPAPELLPGERQLDELTNHWLLGTSRLVLTDRRVLIQRLRWPFTSVSQGAVSLADLQSVRWWSGLNFIFLVGAVLAFRDVMPIALLLLMVAMESMACSLHLVVAFSSHPWSRPGIAALSRRHVPDFHRFHRSVTRAWSAVRCARHGEIPAPAAAGAPARADTDLLGFCWGAPVWIVTLIALVAAVTQRFLGAGVSYDHLLFAPLFLGLPVGIARISPRDGVWAALLSVVAVFSVKFPSAEWLQGHARPGQFLAILAMVIAMSALAGALARLLPPVTALLPLGLWPVYVALDGGRDALDMRVAAITLLALGVAAAVHFVVAATSSAPPGPASEPSAAPESS